jgi:hypothetical protein
MLVGALTGCSLFANAMTQHPYDASDGVSAAVGDVRLLNLIVFSEDGEDGNLIGSAVNSGDQDVDLVLQYESNGSKVDVDLEVPARSVVKFGQDEQLLLAGINTIPGSLLNVYVQYGSEQGQQVGVPVLTTDLPEYDGLLPRPMPTPTPTVTATPEPEETPTP